MIVLMAKVEEGVKVLMTEGKRGGDTLRRTLIAVLVQNLILIPILQTQIVILILIQKIHYLTPVLPVKIDARREREPAKALNLSECRRSQEETKRGEVVITGELGASQKGSLFNDKLLHPPPPTLTKERKNLLSILILTRATYT